MRHKADVRAQNRGSGAGLVVVHLQVPLLAGELFTAVSDVGWLCDWHTNSGPVSQESSGSGVFADSTCFADAHRLLVQFGTHDSIIVVMLYQHTYE